MRAFLVLLAQIGFVVAAGIVLVQLISGPSNPGSTPQQPHFDVQSTGIWTSEPVRVDRRAQDFERLAAPVDPMPLKFRVDNRFRVTANNRFTFNGTTYRLAGIADVDRKHICIDGQGRRYACGLNAFRALGVVTRNKFLECRVLDDMPAEGDEKNVECTLAGRDLRAILAAIPGLPPQQNTP